MKDEVHERWGDFLKEWPEAEEALRDYVLRKDSELRDDGPAPTDEVSRP